MKLISKEVSRAELEYMNIHPPPQISVLATALNETMVWYEKCVLGHNSLGNMLRNMSERAVICPYYTNHSLRATTVTVLSSKNVETRQIKAVTGHRSDTSIQSGNMLRNMSERADLCPYYTNHSLRATTVTVLSSKNVETRQIKAVTGHRNVIQVSKVIVKGQLSASSSRCHQR